MKTKKYLYIMVLVFSIIIFTFFPGSKYVKSSTFTDVKTDSYAADAIEWAASVGMNGGYVDVTFKPNA